MSYYNQPRNDPSSNLKKPNINNTLFSVTQGQLCDTKGVPEEKSHSSYIADQKQFLLNLLQPMIRLLELVDKDPKVFKEFKDICQWSDDHCIILERIGRVSSDSEVNMLFFKCIKLVEFYSLWFAIYHSIHYGSLSDYDTPSMAQVQVSSKLFYNLLYSKTWFKECGFPPMPDAPNLQKYNSIKNYFKEMNQVQQVNRPYSFLAEIGQRSIDGTLFVASDFGKIQYKLLIRLFGEFYGRSASKIHLESMWNRWAHTYFQVPFGGFSQEGWITNFNQIFSAYKKEHV